MQVVILAGGLGTRLWPLTREVPKPMAPIAGAPYLEHQLKLLKRLGLKHVLLLTGYLGDQIEKHFGDGARLGLSIRYSREATPQGTAGALRQARALLEEEFLIIYGDSLLPIDYREPIQAFHQSQAAGLVVVCDNRILDTSVPSNIALNGNGYVVRYDKDGPSDPDLVYVEAGVLAFQRATLDLLPDGARSLEKELFPRLISQRQLISFRAGQRFYDIGTPERLRLIEAFLLNDYHSYSFPD